MNKNIIDVCCGPRGMWFDKNHPDVVYLDKRDEIHENEYPSGFKKTEIKPEIVGDFTNLEYGDNSFNLVVFDPPHIVNGSKKSEIVKRYGVLEGDWQNLIKNGFRECFRVLKQNGVLIFKWNEVHIPVKEILKLTEYKPLFGHKSGKKQKTHWITFMKLTGEDYE